MRGIKKRQRNKMRMRRQVKEKSKKDGQSEEGDAERGWMKRRKKEGDE